MVWKKYREIVAVVAGLVVIAGGIVGSLSFFATKEELRELACEARTGLQLAETNTELLEAETAIFNAKVTRYRIKGELEQGSTNWGNELVKIDHVIDSKTKAKENLSKKQLDLASQLSRCKE